MPFPAFQSGEAAETRAILVSPGPPLVVAICGEVDIQSAPELREELLRVIRRGGPQLIIDLGGVTFLDCAGLNVLVATRRRAQLEGGWVRLVRVPPQARRMISLLKLDGAFGLGTLGSVA
jgi:anti-sigma B factor antagonist